MPDSEPGSAAEQIHDLSRRTLLRWSGGVIVATVSERMALADAPPTTHPTTRAATRPPASRDATPDVVDLSALVRGVRGNERVPGLWGAVVTTKGLRAVGADGWRKARATVPVMVSDHVHLGSCTKAMTATLVGRLVEAGRLTLDRPLSACFAALAAAANPQTAAVTVRQLLDHRGGLPPNVDWRKFDAGPGTIIDKRVAVVRHLLSEAPRHPPGSTYDYSNAGYMTLGAIVEAVHGRAWEDVIAAELFRPLGMTTAGFGPPGTAGLTDQPWGHAKELGVWVPVQGDNAAVLGPAGRVHCSIADWARYVGWTLLADVQDMPLLKRATQAALLTPSGGDYAAGWQITDRRWADGRTLVHAGDNTLWHCVTWLAPRRGFAVLAATNLSDPAATQVCDNLSDALIRWHAAHPDGAS